MISTFILTQKLRLAGSMLMVNAQAMIMFRLWNGLERESIFEELSGIYPKKQLLEMYKLATRKPYSFMYVHLAYPKVENMFWYNFEQRMIPTDTENDVEE